MNAESESVNTAANNVEKLNKKMKDSELTFTAANKIFTESLDIIRSMASEVITLDDALTEFKKVSDLSGESLENYSEYLADLGRNVARTGRPRC